MAETATLQQNETKFSAAQHRAALLLAENELPNDTEIAKAAGVSRATLSRWKKDKDFNGLTGGYIGDIQASMLKFAIAKKHKRIAVLDDLHTRQLSVITQRAERYAKTADTPAEAAQRIFGTNPPPEAATGLLVREETMSAGGGSTVKWSFDASLVKEIRATHEQAAKELGQWVDKTEVGGQVSLIRIVGADVDAL